MRLGTLWFNGAARLASPLTDGSLDLVAAHREAVKRGKAPAGFDMPAGLVDFIAAGDAAKSAAERTLDFAKSLSPAELKAAGAFIPADARFMPVIPNAPRFLCVGRNYLAHAAEAGKQKNDVPILFVRFPSSLVGHKEPVIRPGASEQFDWEVELAVVIGKECRHVKRADALSVVAGYSVFNDGSIRDFQNRGVQWTAGKNFYHTGPFGPWMTTSDEIPDPQTLQLKTHVNGTEVQNSNTAKMIFDVATLIEFITIWTPLGSGDVIVTGTPEGIGMVRQPPWYLKNGDTVRVEIEKLGVLENPVIDE